MRTSTQSVKLSDGVSVLFTGPAPNSKNLRLQGRLQIPGHWHDGCSVLVRSRVASERTQNSAWSVLLVVNLAFQRPIDRYYLTRFNFSVSENPLSQPTNQIWSNGGQKKKALVIVCCRLRPIEISGCGFSTLFKQSYGVQLSGRALDSTRFLGITKTAV